MELLADIYRRHEVLCRQTNWPKLGQVPNHLEGLTWNAKLMLDDQIAVKQHNSKRKYLDYIEYDKQYITLYPQYVRIKSTNYV